MLIINLKNKKKIFIPIKYILLSYNNHNLKRLRSNLSKNLNIKFLFYYKFYFFSNIFKKIKQSNIKNFSTILKKNLKKIISNSSKNLISSIQYIKK